MPAGLPILLERKFQTRENNSKEGEEHSLVWLFPQRIIIMRIKRFASIPLLGAVEENKRTPVLLAKAEPPQTASRHCLFQLKAPSLSSIDCCWGRLAPHSCQGSKLRSCASERWMFLQPSSRWNQREPPGLLSSRLRLPEAVNEIVTSEVSCSLGLTCSEICAFFVVVVDIFGNLSQRASVN